MYLAGKLTQTSPVPEDSSIPLWGHQRSVNENFFMVDLKLQVEMGLRQIKENQVTEGDATGCASDS